MLRFSLLILALGIYLTFLKFTPSQPKTPIKPALQPGSGQALRPSSGQASAENLSDEVGDWGDYRPVLGSNTTLSDCPQVSDINILVDKFHPLPANYVPSDLVDVSGFQLRVMAANSLNTIIKDLAGQGFQIVIDSAFRSFANQQGLYQQTLAQKGNQKGNLTAAPPGFSEHQLGTAVDLRLGSGKAIYPSSAWDWLDQNAHRFGFVMSYRYSQTTRTGYGFEPWHWRYVGPELATKIRFSDKPPQSLYKVASCQ